MLLLLVRHAETDMAGRFCGHSDPELNERGRQQLAELLNRLSEHAIRRVYTSDLRRARQTAEAIAKHFAAGLHVRPGMREIHFGLWEGLSWTEIEARDPVLAKAWAEKYPNSTAPGGESFDQFESRVRGEVAVLLGESTKAPSAVVTHAGFIRVVLTNWCGISEQEAWDRTKDYGSVVALDTDHIDQTAIEDFDCRRPGVRGRPHAL
jgi:alpha-ribazole phosphatase/probable phosphoglycerate mutase